MIKIPSFSERKLIFRLDQYTCIKTKMVQRDVYLIKKVQVCKDQEKAQSEKDSHSKNRCGKKTKLTIRYLYHENIS